MKAYKSTKASVREPKKKILQALNSTELIKLCLGHNTHKEKVLLRKISVYGKRINKCEVYFSLWDISSVRILCHLSKLRRLKEFLFSTDRAVLKIDVQTENKVLYNPLKFFKIINLPAFIARFTFATKLVLFLTERDQQFSDLVWNLTSLEQLRSLKIVIDNPLFAEDMSLLFRSLSRMINLEGLALVGRHLHSRASLYNLSRAIDSLPLKYLNLTFCKPLQDMDMQAVETLFQAIALKALEHLKFDFYVEQPMRESTLLQYIAMVEKLKGLKTLVLSSPHSTTDLLLTQKLQILVLLDKVCLITRDKQKYYQELHPQNTSPKILQTQFSKRGTLKLGY